MVAEEEEEAREAADASVILFFRFRIGVVRLSPLLSLSLSSSEKKRVRHVPLNIFRELSCETKKKRRRCDASLSLSLFIYVHVSTHAYNTSENNENQKKCGIVCNAEKLCIRVSGNDIFSALHTGFLLLLLLSSSSSSL